MAISPEDFAAAQVGQVFVDPTGREWAILEEVRPGADRILNVKCPGYPAEEVIINEGQILERDEWAIIVELNHPNARLADPS